MLYLEIPSFAGLEPRVFRQDARGYWESTFLSMWKRDGARARFYAHGGGNASLEDMMSTMRLEPMNDEAAQ